MGSLRERNPSLWVGTTSESGFAPLAADVSADVAVIGGGIAGVVTAALCRRDGRRVVLLEAGRLAAGTTGYTTAKLSALHGLVYSELAIAFGDEAAWQYAGANLARHHRARRLDRPRRRGAAGAQHRDGGGSRRGRHRHPGRRALHHRGRQPGPAGAAALRRGGLRAPDAACLVELGP